MKEYRNNCRFHLLIFFLLLILSANTEAQIDSNLINKGKFYGDLFLNANYNVEDENLSFRLNRLHFAYTYNLSRNFYFNGMIESAKEDYEPANDSLGGEYNQITNLFEFCLGFQFEKLDGKFGLIGTEFNQQQEKIWQHRAIDKVFADKYGFAPTNDFGAIVNYYPTEFLKFDFAVTNGEGHKSLQADKLLRYAGGGTLTINDLLIMRVYSDLINYNTAAQVNFIAILGIVTTNFSIGAEWNQQTNSAGLKKKNRFGYSFYSNYYFTEKSSLFGRIDKIESNKPSEMTENWNIENDGTTLIFGFQQAINNNLNLAIDYRSWNSEVKESSTKSYIFLNVEILF